ncbi:MAG: hypothetical protein GVY12_09040 [Bacteroidetes bacterium]|nr:hypothetical protein [Bacteroidota bacterium]
MQRSDLTFSIYVITTKIWRHLYEDRSLICVQPLEHNLDVIKSADWVIDLGPEGGLRGGFLVAEGTPEALARHETSHTGRFLREVLP